MFHPIPQRLPHIHHIQTYQRFVWTKRLKNAFRNARIGRHVIIGYDLDANIPDHLAPPAAGFGSLIAI